MSRRKQANPAKLGESDAGTLPMIPATTDHNREEPQPQDDTGDHHNKAEVDDITAIDIKQEHHLDEIENDNANNGHGAREDDEEEEDEAEEENDDDLGVTDDDDDGSLLNGQGGSPLSSSDQASPASSCQSSLSDAADTAEDGGGYTLGATPTTPYECDVCKRAFARSSQLSKHMQTHTEQLQFSCPYCRRLFKHKRSRDRHTKLHTGDKKYKCLHCESAFARSDHLKIHMKTHDNKKPHQCDLCNRGYNTAAALASHQQHHSKQESRRCGSSNSVNSRSSISGSNSSPSPVHARCVCPQCGETFDKPELLQTHLQTCVKSPETTDLIQPNPLNLPLPKIACMYCGKDFTSMAHMYAHIHTEHRAIYNNIPSSTPLDLHSPSGHSVPSAPSESNIEDLSPKTRPNSTPTYACDRCTMRFDSSPSLQEHVESVHWTPTPTPTATPSLGRSHNRYKYDYDVENQQKPTDLSRKRKLESEEYTKSDKRVASEAGKQDGASPYETNDKPCICSYCYAQMPNFKMFLLHMETHVVTPTVQQKAPTCPLCGETAKNALELGRHIFGHAIANVQAYCCHSCKKPFDKADHLRKHLLEAHARTIYKCTICNETFDTDQNLQIHFGSKHTTECKHFRCNLCTDQVFHDRLTAELHVNMKHSISTPITHQASSGVLPTHGTSGTPTGTPNSPFLGFLPDLDPHHDRTPYYQCPFCQKLFKDEYLQYVHILREHNHRLGGLQSLQNLQNLQQVQNLQSLQHISDSKHLQSPSKHLDNQNHNARFRCHVCLKNTSSEQELATHKKLHHSKIRSVSLQCAYCNEHCKSRADLEHHMKSHQVAASGKGKHKCNICDEIFASATTLAEHKLTHCKIVAGNSCTQCKTLLSDEQYFYNHQLQHGSSAGANSGNSKMLSLPANCIVCCQTLQTDVEIKLHASFHLRHLKLQQNQLQNATKDYHCAVCNKLCDSSNLHNINSVFVCKDCVGMAPQATNGIKSPTKSNSPSSFKDFKDYKDFKESKETKTKEKHLYACLKCPRTFTSEEETQNHATTHLLQDEATPSLVCHLCRNMQPSAIKLQIHLIEHNFMGIGQYRCYVCSSVFTTATGLRGHIVEHGPDHKPYECSECDTKFYFETELENHKFLHLQQHKASYEKYVECSRCGASVPEVTYYAEHVHSCAQAPNGNTNNHIVNIKDIKVETNVEYMDAECVHKIKTESNEIEHNVNTTQC